MNAAHISWKMISTFLHSPDKDTFRDWYAAAKHPPESPRPSWYQSRGFQFERALKFLLLEAGLEPRASFRARGEQIDGSFLWGHRHFLLEAKWQKKPVSVKELKAFREKLEGKLVGTVGVFISMSGYTPDAADKLAKRTALDVIMFNQQDMDACMDRQIGFQRVLLAKLRVAAEEGVPEWTFAIKNK